MSYHSLLQRQLKHYGQNICIADSGQTIFLDKINDSYLQFDRERQMLERIIDLTSQELLHMNSGLRALHERLVESTLNGIFAFGADFAVTIWNSSMEHLTGLNQLQTLGKTLPQLFPLLNNETEMTFLRQVFAGISCRTEFPLIWIPLLVENAHYEIHLSPILANRHEIIGGLVEMVDISERKQAEEDRERQHQYFSALQETALRLSNNIEFDDLLNDICKRAIMLLGTDNICIALSDGSYFRITHAGGAFWPLLGSLLPFEETPATEAEEIDWSTVMKTIQTADGLIVMDAVAPIFYNGHLHGMICVQTTAQPRDDQTTKSVLHQLASLICIALNQKALSKANEQLAILANLDPLTKLPNHRMLIERIDQVIDNCRIKQTQCALLFIDLDRFKHINDTWGHRVGDCVLIEASKRMSQVIPINAAIGRYGGEEFVVILPETDTKRALEMAEAIRQVLANSPYHWVDGSYTMASIAITASVGVSLWTVGQTREQFIEAADDAMYYIKNNGRNDVCLAGTRTSQEKNSEKGLLDSAIVKILLLMAQEHNQTNDDRSRCIMHNAVLIGQHLHCSDEALQQMQVAVLLRDIGKITISDASFYKSNSVTNIEWSVMQRHSDIGFQMLAAAGEELAPITRIIIALHERWDGSGYPKGLVGEEIPLGARILAVVEVFAAMIAECVKQNLMSFEQVYSELQSGKGSHFDPRIVDILLQMLAEESLGNSNAA